MRRNDSAIIAIALTILVLAGLVIMFLVNRSNDAVSLTGQPTPDVVTAFMTEREKQGEFAILLSDAYVDECNERLTEFTNLITRASKSGRRMRMLHISRHGRPSRSLDEATRKGPTSSVVADQGFIFQSQALKQIPKPSVLILIDGMVEKVLVDEAMEQWVSQQKGLNDS